MLCVVTAEQHIHNKLLLTYFMLFPGIPTVDFSGWEKIDQVEVQRGTKLGKPREKILDISEMLQIGGVIS